MPNKYNFPQFNIEFTPSKVKLPTNKIVLNIDDAQKKEPVMQIEDENTLQMLYYLDNILFYKNGSTNFFAIQMTSEKGPGMFILFDVVGNANTHDGTSIAKLINALGNVNQNTKQSVSLDFNANLRNRPILRAGNVLYAGSITTSFAFPTSAAVSRTNLPEELFGLTSAPSGADQVKFVQEEIQWVLDCNQIGEYGNETPVLEGNNKYAVIIISVMVGMVIIVGMYLFYGVLKRTDTTSSLAVGALANSSNSIVSTVVGFFTKMKEAYANSKNPQNSATGSPSATSSPSSKLDKVKNLATGITGFFSKKNNTPPP